MGPIRGLGKRKRQQEEEKRRARGVGAPTAATAEPGEWWDGFSRRITGPLNLSNGEDPFKAFLKMSRTTFNYICSLVMDNLVVKPPNFTFLDGQPLSVNDQVAVALRRLNSGDSLLNVGLAVNINQSAVSQVTWRFVEAMEKRAFHHLKWPSSEEEMKSIKQKYEKVYGLPNCCGAIDITHVNMCLSTMDPASKVWIDYEKNYSMVLQAIVDPQMRFRDIVTGWPGSLNDYSLLQNSGIFTLCEKGMRLNGKMMELFPGKECGEYIVGDEGFPLLPWLLTPYQDKDLSGSKKEFNKRHLAARSVAEKALVRLKDMWKILQGEMWRPDRNRLPRIIHVCCLLHNIIIDLEDEVRDETAHNNNHDARYKQLFCVVVNKNASEMRDCLTRYLSGKLPP